MFWNISKSLSYNCLFNFIVGDRGVGKTYGAKEWAIKDFLKNGSQFVYVRRYKSELKRLNNFFNDISGKFEGHEFKVNPPLFYIDGEIAGTAIALSTAKIEKSTPYPKVNKILFDEFILDNGYHKYLPDEVVNFLELYNTIARKRDVRVYFLSNALTITNPYFLYFNIKMPYNSNISAKDDILIERATNKEYVNEMGQTRFGKIIKDTDYFSYSYGSTFLRDTDVFIEKKTNTSKYFFTMLFKGNTYGVWYDIEHTGKIYVSNDIEENCKIKYSLTVDDHSPNTMLLKGHASSFVDKFLKYYKLGLVRFESVNIKNICEQIIKMTM